MNWENLQEKLEVYGDNSDATAEAYSRHITKVSDDLGVEIEPSTVEGHELHAGETHVETGDSYTQFSDLEVYRSHMIDKFSLVRGVDDIINNKDYPVHEVAEAAGHLVSEVPVGGRPKDDVADTVVNEYFGALGLGLYDSDILENDRRMLERNLEIQKEFFGEEHVRYVVDNKDVYVEVADQLYELLTEGRFEEFKQKSRSAHEELLSRAPSILFDFENYSWSRQYDVGTFSEFFTETYVTPTMPEEIRNIDLKSDKQQLEKNLNATRKQIRECHKNDISDLRDRVHSKASENNRAYMVARTLAQEEFKQGLARSRHLIEQDNSAIWSKIEEECSRINGKLHSEFDIPRDSQNSEE